MALRPVNPPSMTEPPLCAQTRAPPIAQSPPDLPPSPRDIDRGRKDNRSRSKRDLPVPGDGDATPRARIRLASASARDNPAPPHLVRHGNATRIVQRNQNLTRRISVALPSVERIPAAVGPLQCQQSANHWRPICSRRSRPGKPGQLPRPLLGTRRVAEQPLPLARATRAATSAF